MDEEDMSDIEYHLEWRKVQTRSYLNPPLKASSASVRLGDDLYLFGGQGAGQFHEVWKFCGKTLVWEEVVCTSSQLSDMPTARDGHTLVKVSETKLIVYAGQGGLFDSGKCERATEHGKVKYLSMRKLFDDMFELDVSTSHWTCKPRRKIRPLGRRGHTMTFLKPPSHGGKKSEDSGKEKLGSLLLFGGSCLDTSTGFEKVSNDVWLYSLSDEQWTEAECSGVRPRAVYGHSGVLVDDSYIVIGGSYAPPKKEGFLSKAKAMAPKKKTANLFSSALSENGDNNNIISVLNVSTFQWSFLNIDCIPHDLDSPAPMLNLTGHSAMINPLNVREILIFGGRTVETDNTHHDYLNTPDDASFVPANLFTLNIDECTLKQVETKNDPDDTVNVPEARLNHICHRNIEGHIVLNYNREDAKSKKMKNGRRIFDITAKKKPILGQAVTLVFGGFKANSPGFCDCSVHELFFVPNHTRKKKDDSEIKLIAPEEKNSSVPLNDDNTSYISKLSVETFDIDDRSNAERAVFDRSRLYEVESCGSNASTKALKLKPDCSTQLLSPKRGVDGHYFDIKSALSFSKSSFVPSSSKVHKCPESEPHSSHSSVLDPLSHKGSLAAGTGGVLGGKGNSGEEEEDKGDAAQSVSSSGTVLTAERMHFMSVREIMKTRTHEIAPKTKGMTVHNARSVYNRLYPLPGLPSALKKKARNLK